MNLVNVCFVTAFCPVARALLAVCFLYIPSHPLVQKNHGPRYHCWGKMDVRETALPKDSGEGDQLGGRFYYPGTSLLCLNHSLSSESDLEINTKFQREKHHFPRALVTRILKPLVLFIV